MKQRSRTDLRQTELFREPELNSVAIPLPATREAELKRAIAELLLNVSGAGAGVPKGDECDE
jgi:hypothetical protein